MPYTLDGMRNYYEENKQDYLAPVLHDAIENIAQLKAENEALREYVRHRRGCQSALEDKSCVCGLVALLKGGDDDV